MWRPDRGTSPNRSFVLVSHDVWREFQFRWAQIQPLVWLGAHPSDVEYQRDELRAWAKERASYGMAGLYMIPV